MKCGICGKDTFLGFRGEQIQIRDHRVLNQHKRAEHRAEYVAAVDSRRAKMETTRQAKAAEAQRVGDARLAASRPVVERAWRVNVPVTYPSSNVRRYQVSGDHATTVRFPDAAAYRQYERIMEGIAALEVEARIHLTAAWERGTPVTLEHLDALDRAAIVPSP